MSYRTEKDPLGELQVPSEALYGVQTQRAIHNFPISGIRPHSAFVWGTVLIKRAAAVTHKEHQRLDPRVADAIISAADQILSGMHHDQFVVDIFQAGAGTSHNMNANELLANMANESLGGTRGEYTPVHPNDHVNMSQSTNDVIPTAIALGALRLLPTLYDGLDTLAKELEDKSKSWDHIIKTGRTHLQDATPLRLGQEFGAYAEAIRRDKAIIQAAEMPIRELSVGGTAVGTGLNAEPKYQTRIIEVIRESGALPVKRSENLFYSMQSMSRFANLSGSLRTLSTDLMRIANDFRLLGSGPRTGFAEILLPAIQPGSSIMPGKVNPVLAECMNMICLQISGNDVTISHAAEAGQLQLNVMMPIIGFNLCQSIEILGNGTRSFAEHCVSGLEADERMIKFWLDRNTMLATALAPRIGYARAAEIAKEAVKTGESVPEVARRLTDIQDDELNEALDPAPMTEAGIRSDDS